MALGIDAFNNSSGSGKPFIIKLPDKGPTRLQGTASADIVLMRYASPFFIDSTITVPRGHSLTIEPGVEVYFADGAGVVCDGGIIKVPGTEKNPVSLFPWNSRWKGIAATADTDTVISIKHAIIKGADTAVASKGGGVSLSGVNCARCSTALVLKNTSAWLYDCVFRKNDVALRANDSTISINHAAFLKNEKNIVAGDLKKELLPEKKMRDFSAYLSGQRLMPARGEQKPTLLDKE